MKQKEPIEINSLLIMIKTTKMYADVLRDEYLRAVRRSAPYAYTYLEGAKKMWGAASDMKLALASREIEVSREEDAKAFDTLCEG